MTSDILQLIDGAIPSMMENVACQILEDKLTELTKAYCERLGTLHLLDEQALRADFRQLIDCTRIKTTEKPH